VPTITRSNWRVAFYWSQGSGLRLGTCRYLGQLVVRAASVPFVYVNYAGTSSGPFTDKLRSKQRRIEVREIMFGFDLKVTYDFYGEDYEYNHIWRFHEDGQFGSSIVIQGPGEEDHGRHTYHLPFRFDLGISDSGTDSFQKRLNGKWTDVTKEGRYRSQAAPEFEWRLTDKARSRAIGVRARVGDHAELWALQYKKSESWSTWGAALGGAPGTSNSVPAVYDNNQTVQNTHVVLWYIAHVASVDRVAACGPWLQLDGYPKKAPHM
jgi:hypothetical protein